MMPTIEAWNATTTRAADLGYRVLIVDTSHVELISAATGRVMARVAAWGDVVGWLDTHEQEERQWRKAA